MNYQTKKLLIGGAITLATMLGGFSVAECSSCTPAQQLKVMQIETDLCKARAAYKLAALAAGGALDPAAGSPRADLEQAEDAFCLARKDAGQ